MAYLLNEDEQITVNGRTFNGDTRAFVKNVILDREQKTANIVFKIYWGDKQFELANYNYNVTDRTDINEEGIEEVKNYFTDYFDTPVEETGLTAIEIQKKQAYNFINDNLETIGVFEKSKWGSDV